jgi:hypothetical protein
MDIHRDTFSNLAQIADTLRDGGVLSRSRKRWQQHAGQNGYNGDDDEQLDQSECASGEPRQLTLLILDHNSLHGYFALAK